MDSKRRSEDAVCKPRLRVGSLVGRHSVEPRSLVGRDSLEPRSLVGQHSVEPRSLVGRESVEPRVEVGLPISPRLDELSASRSDRTGTHGCHEGRFNYFGNTMLVRPFMKYWAPVIAWLVSIFIGSGDMMSAEHTSRFLIPFLLWLKPDISVETLALIQFCTRKAAHLTEYAILALLLCRAIFRGTNRKWTMPTLYMTAWIACLLAAIGDEFRQSFVESRGASPWDVMIDSAGAIFGLLISWSLARRRPRKM